MKGPSLAGVRTGRGPRPPWEADVLLHNGTHVKDERAPRHPVHRLVEQSCGETGRREITTHGEVKVNAPAGAARPGGGASAC